MQKEDGTSVYLAITVAPVVLSKKEIDKELSELSRELGGPPATAKWTDQTSQRPASFIAMWGDLKLEAIDIDSDQVVGAGKNPKIGMLVGALGDLRRSTKAGYAIYRIAGGTGYLYSASFDKTGRGHRQYIAADGNELAVRQYEIALPALLLKDQSLPADDFRLWPEIADITRRLSRGTSSKIANDALDKVFERVQSKKLSSHVWAFIPGGAIEHLSMNQHWDVDIYGPKTEHPEIRSNIQTFLTGKPSDRFSELLHYVIGEYDEALRVNPNSPLKGVLHYASGFKKLGALLHDTIQILKLRTTEDVDEPDEIFRKLNFLIENEKLFDAKPLSTVVPNFSDRAAAAKAHFEIVLSDTKAPHADDAAFMLGWLTLHEGRTKEALPYFSKAMVVGNGDYKDPGAVRRVMSVLASITWREQIAIVDADPNFAVQPALAYVAARAAYREFNYTETIAAATRYLKAMGVQAEQLPATTDPSRIGDSIEKVQSKFEQNPNLSEIPYLLQASKEFLQYGTFLQTLSNQQPENVVKRARTIIIKYSTILDEEKNKSSKKRGLLEFTHRDYRQAIHMIDLTLASTPRTDVYARLREWLYYRKVRLSVQFSPGTIEETIAAMAAEFPNSRLLDDVLAEQLSSQEKDLPAARKTFQKLVNNYPKGNAVDNAYALMVEILSLNDQCREANKMNREIIRLFPLSRHAAEARQRSDRSCE
jgi:tetratricopeptide (TPR) repeat protein